MLHVHMGWSEFRGFIVLSVDKSKNEKENCRREGKITIITSIPRAMLSLNQETVHQ